MNATCFKRSVTSNYRLMAVLRLFHRNPICICVSFLITATGDLLAASHYVRSGSVGAATGADWADAYPNLPGTLTRGDTYYIADGNYGFYTFDDAVSGTNLISIKKATVGDHGTSIGWTDNYGAGQAVFTGWSVTTPHWLIDGQTGGGPGAWTTGYGFKLSNPSYAAGAHLLDSGGRSGVSDLMVKHVEMTFSNNFDKGTYATGIYFASGITRLTLSHCAIYEIPGDIAQLRSAFEFVAEYCYLSKNLSVAAKHGDVFEHDGTATNHIYRYNWFRDCVGTYAICDQSGSGALGDVRIYGNVWSWSTPGGFDNGLVATDTVGTGISGIRFYNNTIYNFSEHSASHAGFSVSGGSDNVVTNNIWYGASDTGNNLNITWGGITYHDYNTFRYAGTQSEAHSQNLTSNIFANAANGDFSLLVGTAAGASLGSNYSSDLNGIVRGGDGNWDRGACEFGSGSAIVDTNAPVISNVSVTPGTSSALLTWLTSEPADSGVDYGATAAYGQSVTVGSLVINHTLALSNLSAGSLLHYRVRSRDAASNQTSSGDFTVTTLAVDVLQPSGSMTSPQGGAIVSGTVALSATASDNVGGSGVAVVGFWLNNTLVGSSSNAPYRLAWDSRTVTNGIYSTKVRIADAAGNQADSAIVIITVDNPPLTTVDGLVMRLAFHRKDGVAAADLSGNGNTGAIVSTAWNSGELIRGLRLNGIDESVRVESSESLQTVSNALTVCVWVNLASNGVWQAVVRKVLQDGSHVFPYAAYDLVAEDVGGAYRPRLTVSRTDGVRGVVYGSAPLNYGTWHNLVGVYDGTELRMYVDGGLAGSSAFSGSIIQPAQPLYMGRNGVGGDQLKGMIYEFRIYNRALTAVEVTQLYKSVPQSPLLLPVSGT